MADLQLLLQQLTQDQIDLQNHITALANAQAAPAVAACKKVVADPGTYDGSPTKFHEWWSKIKIWMQVAAAVYSQLTGPKAGHWAQVHLDHCMAVAHMLAAALAGHNLPAAWPTWGDLTAEIEGFFLPSNNREWARAQLLRLRQGLHQRMDEFLAQFKALKVQSGCPDEYARDLLKRAVSRKSWSRCTCRLSPGIRTLISVIRYATWEGPRSSSLSILRGPHDTSRALICHLPLPHLAAVHQWTSAPQTHAPNLVRRGYNATTVRGLAISHVSAHSHASPGNNSRPGVHLSEGSGRKQTNNQHKMTTVVSGGLPLRFWYQTSSRCIVHAFG
ncbi:hypothetical protein SCLCIDRAFT_1154903 [Scleroderma citrinum Foug A]|uniref:Retrotransposon gag domain-containing protein n=1 Tax=Scleroderma citrinum Foug A TaxID=1036808 RepID=A0A0C3DDM0_9AGAM|nr:hypothetical protein SCLCIDRAFT_1154903 [Scleroderma citrinum Foug A]